MALRKRIDLQLFADDGGDGGVAATTEASSASTVTTDTSGSGTEYPSNIPERAKKYYDMATKKAQKVDTAIPETPVATTPTEEETGTASNKKLTYKEMIESEDYKADHEKYVQKLLKDRMKKHNAEAEKDLELLHLVGRKYGLDANSQTFKEDLSSAIKADDGIYEKYAQEHDVPIEEAKRMVGIEQQLERATKEEEQRRVAEEDAKVINALRDKGRETQSVYPDFNLDEQMADERFRRLVVAFNGDTTQAYEAINHKALTRRAVAEAEANAQRAVSNSVKANLSRPAEGGISSTSIADSAPDFRSMGIDGLRAWAAKQRIKR